MAALYRDDLWQILVLTHAFLSLLLILGSPVPLFALFVRSTSIELLLCLWHSYFWVRDLEQRPGSRVPALLRFAFQWGKKGNIQSRERLSWGMSYLEGPVRGELAAGIQEREQTVQGSSEEQSQWSQSPGNCGFMRQSRTTLLSFLCIV